MINQEIVTAIRQGYHARGHNHKHYHQGSLGFGFVHYALIRNVRPERVLVIGSQRGFVPAICALACKDEGTGHVDFVDAGYDLSHEKSWGGIGIWKTALPSYWESLEVQSWITLHCMTTEQFVVTDPGRYQYIYVDGDHSLEGVSADFGALNPLLDPGGFMVFHDVFEDKLTERYGRCGVKRFWNDTFFRGFEKLSLPFDVGLGILRKVEEQ